MVFNSALYTIFNVEITVSLYLIVICPFKLSYTNILVNIATGKNSVVAVAILELLLYNAYALRTLYHVWVPTYFDFVYRGNGSSLNCR